jgi:hypothetical protein
MTNYCLRVRDPDLDSPVKTDGDQVIVWVDLPEGTTLQQAWSPPLDSPTFPWATMDVDLLVDGKLAARGVWPNLQPIG